MAIRLYKFLLFLVIFSSLLTIYMHASHIFTYVHVCLYVCMFYMYIVYVYFFRQRPILSYRVLIVCGTDDGDGDGGNAGPEPGLGAETTQQTQYI